MNLARKMFWTNKPKKAERRKGTADRNGMGLWDRLFSRKVGTGGGDTPYDASGHPTRLPGDERDYDRGIQLYDAGRYDEAIQAFEAVLAGRRTGPLVERLARFYLAESYSGSALANLRSGDESAEAAAQKLRTAIAINPNYADLHFRLGSTLLKQNKPEEAVDSLRKSLEINPRYAQALLHLMVALLRVPGNHIEELLSLVSHAARQGIGAGKPDLDEAKNAIKDNDTDRAAKILAHLMESPEDDQALVLAANALDMFRQGRYAEAESAYRSALERKPHYADLRNQLGVTLFAQNRDEEAMQQFDEAVAINSRYAEAHLNRGFALFRLGRESEALEAVRLAMEFDPDNAVMMVRLKKMFPEIERPTS